MALMAKHPLFISTKQDNVNAYANNMQLPQTIIQSGNSKLEVIVYLNNTFYLI